MPYVPLIIKNDWLLRTAGLYNSREFFSITNETINKNMYPKYYYYFYYKTKFTWKGTIFMGNSYAHLIYKKSVYLLLLFHIRKHDLKLRNSLIPMECLTFNDISSAFLAVLNPFPTNMLQHVIHEYIVSAAYRIGKMRWSVTTARQTDTKDEG